MVTKGRGPDEVLDVGRASDPALAAWYRLMRLKRLYRQGWLKRGLPEGETESVADHSFGSALLVLLLAGGRELGTGDRGFDAGRAALMALVHELGEAYAGDITPADGVASGEKRRLERESLDRALEGMEDAAWLRGLWEEYESGESAEARFVREVDRLEMGLQAALIHGEGRDGMGEFFASARGVLREPRLAAILEDAVALAEQAWGRGPSHG